MATSRIVGDWVLVKFIGEGSFGKVFLGHHHRLCSLRVIKEIDLSTCAKEYIMEEVKALQRLRGRRNIVQISEAFENGDCMYIVMEYCRGGDLGQYLKVKGSVDEATCRHFMCQLRDGLKALRDNNIAHCDLKPDNLLLSDDSSTPVLKIADFGCATSYGPEGLSSCCGTVPYTAPEMERGPCGPESDLWSVGVMMYELLTGELPFRGDNYYDLMKSAKRDKVKLPDDITEKLTPGCRHLLHNLLKRNPSKRLSLEAFFRHPFLAGTDASAAITEEDLEEDDEDERYYGDDEDEEYDMSDEEDVEEDDSGEQEDVEDNDNDDNDEQEDHEVEQKAARVPPGPSCNVPQLPLRHLLVLQEAMRVQKAAVGEAAAEKGTAGEQAAARVGDAAKGSIGDVAAVTSAAVAAAKAYQVCSYGIESHISDGAAAASPQLTLRVAGLLLDSACRSSSEVVQLSAMARESTGCKRLVEVGGSHRVEAAAAANNNCRLANRLAAAVQNGSWAAAPRAVDLGQDEGSQPLATDLAASKIKLAKSSSSSSSSSSSPSHVQGPSSACKAGAKQHIQSAPGASQRDVSTVAAALVQHTGALQGVLDKYLHGMMAELMDAPRDLDCMLSVALHHSCAAADAEQRGNTVRAVVECGKAADVLLFLLTAPQHLQSHQQPVARTYPGALGALYQALAAHDEHQRIIVMYKDMRLRKSVLLAGLQPASVLSRLPSLDLAGTTVSVPLAAPVAPSAAPASAPSSPPATRRIWWPWMAGLGIAPLA